MINIQRKKIQLKGNLIILDKLQYQKETFGSKVRFCVHFTGPISTIRGLCPFTLEQIFCYISGCEFSQLLICYWIFSFANYVTLTHHFNVYLENNIFIIQLFLIIWLSGLLFKLCLKGSPRMNLLHVLKILWVFVKNVHNKIKYFRQDFQEMARM
jgi:hypothetical protein